MTSMIPKCNKAVGRPILSCVRRHMNYHRILESEISSQNDAEIIVARNVPHLCPSVPNVARVLDACFF